MRKGRGGIDKMPEHEMVMHFLVPDEDGPIKSNGVKVGAEKQGGGQFRVACDKEKKIAGADSDYRWSYTVWWKIVSCEECKKTEEYIRVAGVVVTNAKES